MNGRVCPAVCVDSRASRARGRVGDLGSRAHVGQGGTPPIDADLAPGGFAFAAEYAEFHPGQRIA